MKIGTKSILFGAHQFMIHPWFVAAAWTKLYGFPWDPRLWAAFFVHDLGYWGMPNMDGAEGEEHPLLGARIMGDLFDEYLPGTERWRVFARVCNWTFGFQGRAYWFNSTLFHSRFLCKRYGAHFSKLCVADKLSFGMTPMWLYLPMANLTGEVHEYMKLANRTDPGAGPKKYLYMNIDTGSQIAWWKSVRDYMTEWAWTHKDLIPDTWTPDTREKEMSSVGNGAWK